MSAPAMFPAPTKPMVLFCIALTILRQSPPLTMSAELRLDRPYLVVALFQTLENDDRRFFDRSAGHVDDRPRSVSREEAARESELLFDVLPQSVVGFLRHAELAKARLPDLAELIETNRE